MRFNKKRLVAGIAVIAMACTVVPAFATTPIVSIASVEIHDGTTYGAPIVPVDPVTSVATVTSANVIKVTATVTNPVAEAQVSILSCASGEEVLTNDNIQYIEQEAIFDGGNAVFEFRPRELEPGDYIVKVGTTDATDVAQFTYTVEVADKTMAVTSNTTYPANLIVDTTFSITNLNVALAEDAIKRDGTPLVKDTDYTLTQDLEAGTAVLIIKKAAIPDTPATYNYTIDAEGYNQATATIVVTEKETEIVDKEAAQGALDEVVADLFNDPTETDGKFSIDLSGHKSTADGTEKNVTFVVNKMSGGVTLNDGKLEFEFVEGVTAFVGKAQITAKVGLDVTTIKEVYFVPGDTKIGFGNITALDNNLADAFGAGVANEAFAAWMEVPENATAVSDAKLKAIAVATGRMKPDEIAQSDETLDYNRKDDISLNEYNIYRKMVEGFTGFDIEKVQENRPSAQ